MENEIKCPRCGKVFMAEIGKDIGLCPSCAFSFALKGTEGGQSVEQDPELSGRFGPYEIIEKIGQGGMGVVYKAKQPSLDRFVALKVLPKKFSDDPDFVARFNREARALAKLTHQNIVSIHEFGMEQGRYYIAMEYVDGVSLRNVLNQSRLKPKEALKIVPQLCDALQCAHDQGIVHRDIKPENILVDKGGKIKVTDFGIAKIILGNELLPRVTQTHSIMGTKYYMAPEQEFDPKKVDHRADIYSMGVVFYEMLTGELPIGHFQKPSEKVQIDVNLDEVVLRTLAKEPERRYQLAMEVKDRVSQVTSNKMQLRSLYDKKNPSWIIPLVALILINIPYHLEIVVIELAKLQILSDSQFIKLHNWGGNIITLIGLIFLVLTAVFHGRSLASFICGLSLIMGIVFAFYINTLYESKVFSADNPILSLVSTVTGVWGLVDIKVHKSNKENSVFALFGVLCGITFLLIVPHAVNFDMPLLELSIP